MMSLSKALYRSVFIVTLVTLVGCAAPAPAPATEAAPADKPAVTEAPAAATEAPAAGAKTYKTLVVGFAQIGAESGWRDGETQSIKDTAAKLGVDLKFSDGQQKQENQIKALRAFIAQKVDVIGIPPVVTTGFEPVLKEAKDAGIPVIFIDRKADVPEDYYATFIGSDFVLEGKNAAIELAKLVDNKANIVELEGTVGAGPAIDRKKGFDDEVAANYKDIKILESQSGDFTLAKGKEVMQAFLKKYPDQIQAVYAHNDEMALGAIQAIEEAGLKPGVDIKIVSIDGEKAIFEAMAAGKANVTVECNPMLGPQFFEAALKLANGEKVDKWIKSNEGIFRQDTAAKELPNRVY
jgi:ABC-type sugar transport system substrate-binding protein